MLSLASNLTKRKEKPISIVQSVIFDKELYTIQDSINWLSFHGYVHESAISRANPYGEPTYLGKVEITKNSHIFILVKEKEREKAKGITTKISLGVKTYA